MQVRGICEVVFNKVAIADITKTPPAIKNPDMALAVPPNFGKILENFPALLGKIRPPRKKISQTGIKIIDKLIGIKKARPSIRKLVIKEPIIA